MMFRTASLLVASLLLLASCQTAKSALVAPPWEGTTVASSGETAEEVVLMHSSQGPEPAEVVVPAAEARALKAARVGREQR